MYEQHRSAHLYRIFTGIETHFRTKFTERGRCDCVRVNLYILKYATLYLHTVFQLFNNLR